MESLLPLVIPLAFVAFWCFVCFIVVLASGWRRLAPSFRVSHAPQGQKFGMQQAFINSTRFNGPLTIIVSPEGLYMKIWPLFSVFGLAAPPLLIPWSQLAPLQHERRAWFEAWSTSVPSARVSITLLSRATAQAASQFLPQGQSTRRVSL